MTTSKTTTTKPSAKFGTKVAFETVDQGGTFQPLELPDLTPYRERNRETLMRDFERNEQLGLAELKLEQDKFHLQELNLMLCRKIDTFQKV